MINLTKNLPIVCSDGPIVLVGGGSIGPHDLEMLLIRANLVVAADGGAAPLIAFGRMPDAVIGDLDSLDTRTREQLPEDRVFHIPEQDSTDFDKALRSVDAPLVLGAGFLGARLDHQLAVLNVLARRQDRPCILLGAHEIVFHAPPRIAFDATPGDPISLFPLQQVTGRSSGLEWPIDGLVFDPAGQVGTSNRAVGRVELQMEVPGLLVMAPRPALDQVMQAFVSGQTGRWPSRVE